MGRSGHAAAAAQDHGEGVGGGAELRLRMAGAHHLLDHAVDAQPQLLDVAPLEQAVDQPRVAREVLVDDVVEGDVAGQAAGAADLQPVVELADLDAPAGEPVVAVADGVDQRLAHGEGRVEHAVLALQAAHHRLAAHLLQQDGPGALDDARQRAVELLAPAVARQPARAARLGADEAHVDQPALGDEGLRLPAEQQQPRHGRLALAGQRAGRRQDLLLALAQVAAQARRAALQVVLDHLVVQVGARGAGHGLDLEVAAGLGGGQLADLRRRPAAGCRRGCGSARGRRPGCGARCCAAPGWPPRSPTRSSNCCQSVRTSGRHWLKRGAQQALGVLRLQGAQHLAVARPRRAAPCRRRRWRTRPASRPARRPTARA